MLAKGDIKGAFGKAQKWCRKRSQAAPKPTYQDEKVTRKEFEELHTAAAPAGEPIPIHITPTPRIDDQPPEEEEVKKGVRRISNGQSAGAAGMTVERIKELMAGAEDKVCPTCVEEQKMAMDLVKRCFTNDGEDAPSSFEVGTLALTPKDVTSYRGIVLLRSASWH